MKILFLDDMQARHDHFLRNNALRHDIRCVYTAEEAIKALESESFDLACLDHDLAPEHYTGDDFNWAGTGFDVVDRIRAMVPERRPKMVIVHSMNSVRAPQMVTALREAGVRSHWNLFSPTWSI